MSKRYDAGEVVTAMVTPFNKNKEIDYKKVEELAKYLVKNGSDAILVAGTTGECPTLTNEEELELLSVIKKAVGDKAKIIMGAGSNSTETAVKMTKRIEKEGVDAILSVVPYYNKPSQAGMIAHFSAIAETTKLPIILYNIPGRTGVNMDVSTIKFLAEKYRNIIAVKQSFPDMDTISELRLACPEDFVIYSGDDSLTLPMLSIGVHGVISVASHLWGNEIKTMIHNFKTGNFNVAKNMHLKLYPVLKKIFMAPNPVPIKAALERAGLISNYVRLPLVPLAEEQKRELFEVIDAFNKD
ncbi:MAG: 4-hydroxy-tetrahydrodipicolinate synthase [Candidatus Gastranaerophilales bacterium]|nr:4-hydroxy-tetrahydrodipicolinate synthase [Candidatus Gastranaerophilales bacterium]